MDERQQWREIYEAPDERTQAQRIIDLLPQGGLIQGLGITFQLDDNGTPVASMTIDDRHRGGPGVAHGGALSALMDSALGAHAFVMAASRGQATSTVELKTNFLRPVPLGRTLYTSTSVQSAGRSLLVLAGRAFDESTGKPVAFSVGTFNLYRPGSAGRKD